jgi:hypothetical protein
MPIKTGPYLDTKEVFIDYPYEEVMFRRDHISGLVYRKFYGDSEFSEPIHHSNNLYNESLLYGDEITRELYEAGKPRKK